jgi:hypothetical protein
MDNVAYVYQAKLLQIYPAASPLVFRKEESMRRHKRVSSEVATVLTLRVLVFWESTLFGGEFKL